MENIVEWPYLCDVCNKAFSKQSHLIRYQGINTQIMESNHQHTNNGEQPFEFIYWFVKEFELSLQKWFTRTRTHNDACRK